jgi:hypothetical protein
MEAMVLRRSKLLRACFRQRRLAPMARVFVVVVFYPLEAVEFWST